MQKNMSCKYIIVGVVNIILYKLRQLKLFRQSFMMKLIR